ncbi:XAC2610-related protein [Pedobacter agri]|uniref:XAC2610-related protein n=1 Tax=Pedobacter agri TaxID=454586 RepID=UPI002785DF3E|nr:hypothetical protein [Pedobacter agri]MDQ1139921.1 hypothetical protein [Pedobacter agri]
MKNLFILALLFSSFKSVAQFKFLANNCSNQYKAKIFVAECDNGLCEGMSTIILYDKISDKELETFHSADLDFSLTDKQDARIGWLELGKYQSPLIFGDFNFDGKEDMAIRNGSNGAYMSPSYDIYLSVGNNKFLANKELTTLASENLGTFEFDQKTKWLTIEQKDGCCYHKTINYSIDVRNKITEVSSVIEDSSVGNVVTVITQKKVGARMIKTVQRFKTEEYYKNDQ